MKKLMAIVVSALCAAVAFGDEPVDLVKAIRAAGLEPTITASAAEKQRLNIYDSNGDTQWEPTENNWNCLAVPAEFRPGEKIILKGYTVKNSEGADKNYTKYTKRVAHTWDIEGSNDGETWTKLDSKADVVWYGSASYVYGERSYTYELENTESYRYYRINVIKSRADGYCSFTWLDYLVDIVSAGGDFRYTANSVTCTYDGEGHAVSVTTYEDKPADLVITYATEPDGEYGPNPTAFSEVGVHTNWIHLTSGGKTISDFATVSILPVDIQPEWVSLPSEVEYTGKACEPTVTVTRPGTGELEKDRDFTVAYSDNVACGTAKATVTGKGSYAGTVEKTFVIKLGQITGPVWVSPSGRDDGDGTAEHPLPLSTVVASLGPGAVVHLAAGTYAESAVIALTAATGVTFEGVSREEVVIDGGETHQIFALSGCENVVFRNLTLTRGAANAAEGGAVFATGSKDILFDTCAFKTNSAVGQSGGALAAVASSSVTVSNSLFEANTALHNGSSGMGGGAVYAKESTFATANSVFRRNKATSTNNQFSKGAAAYFGISTTVSFSNCLVVQNGGLSENSVNPCFSAIDMTADPSNPGTLVIDRCTIAENLTLIGVHTFRGNVTETDSIIWGHLCDDSDQLAVSRSNVFVGFVHYWDGGTSRCNYDGFKNQGPTFYEGRPDFDVDYRLTAASVVTGKGYVHPTDAATEVRTWFVAPNGDDEAAGSEAAPFRTIARALKSATDGDTIRLAEGTYSAATTGEMFPIDLTDRFFVTFEGAGRGKTVLDGENAAAAFWTLDQSDHIVLKGMTMRRSCQTAAASGCGVSAKRNGTLFLRELDFEDCALVPADKTLAASIWRGPISIVNSTYAEVEDCSVQDTTADFTDCTNAQTLQGAGLYAYYAQVRAERCSFTDASVTGNGTLASGVYGGRANKCMATLLLRNALLAQAGGVAADYVYTYLYNNTVTGNACGLYCNNGTSRTFLNAANNLIYGNDDDCSGCSDADNNVIIHIFANNLFTSTTTDYLQHENVSGNTWTHLAPSGTQLADRSPFAGGKHPYSLRRSETGSINPAIDNACTYDWMTDAIDLAGKPRISKSTRKGEELPDIGCYELPCYAPGLILLLW